MMFRLFAVVVLLAVAVHANEYSTPKKCNGKCCDTSDFANWPCPSWSDSHYTSMCRTLSGGQYSCECAPGLSGDNCAGGAKQEADSKTEPCKAVSCEGVGVACKNDDDCHDADGEVGAEVCYQGNCAKKCDKAEDCGHEGWSKCVKNSKGIGHCDKTCVEHEECPKGETGCNIWVGHCSCNSGHKGLTCGESVHCKDSKGKEMDCHHGKCAVNAKGDAECLCESGFEVYTADKKSDLYGTCVVDTGCTKQEQDTCMKGNALCRSVNKKAKCECNQGWGKSAQTDMHACDVELSDRETAPSPQWKKHILDAHNVVRSIVGSVSGSSENAKKYQTWAKKSASDFKNVDKINKPAEAMPSMVWSEALAANMAKHYKQNGCKMSHSTSSFRSNIAMGSHIHGPASESTFNYVGENLYYSWGGATHTPDDCTGDSCGAAERNSVYSWFSEIEDVASVSGDRPKSNGKAIGHYTQIVWAKSKYVGCAYCTKGSETHIGCQYGPGGNYGSQPPYKTKSSGATRMINPNIDEAEWNEFHQVEDVSIATDSVGDAVFYNQRSSSVVVVVGVVVAVAVVAVVVAAVAVKRRRASQSALEVELCDTQ